MQFAGNTSGQDRTLKYQISSTSQPLDNDGTRIVPVASRSVYESEKSDVKNDDVTVAGEPGAVTEKSSNSDPEKGGLQRSNSSRSSLAAPYDDKDDFPEGGLKAWSVVLGAFCGSFSVFGIINSTAVLMDYFQQHQLKEYNSSQIGWIFGFALFLTFFCMLMPFNGRYFYLILLDKLDPAAEHN